MEVLFSVDEIIDLLLDRIGGILLEEVQGVINASDGFKLRMSSGSTAHELKLPVEDAFSMKPRRHSIVHYQLKEHISSILFSCTS